LSSPRHQVDIFVLRYVPNILEEKFVEIGVLLCPVDDAGYAACRFLDDWRRLRSVDAQADVAMVQSLVREIERAWEQPFERAALVRRMLTSYSGGVQLFLAETVVTDDPAKELERLVRRFL